MLSFAAFGYRPNLVFGLLWFSFWLLANPKPAPAQRPPAATVLVFLDTECPICQQYTRPLAELHRQFATRGVRFQAIFPTSTDSRAVVTTFCNRYKLPFDGQPDPARLLVRQYRATVTPEVVVLDARGVRVYQGAIDDWYVALGRYRREPTQPYLHDALQAVLEGRLPITSRTEPVGCRIQ